MTQIDEFDFVAIALFRGPLATLRDAAHQVLDEHFEPGRFTVREDLRDDRFWKSNLPAVYLIEDRSRS